MKKLKSSEPLDRLSELPDSLIFDIFDFLPMTEVVRTTILSHRWRNLWKTAPNLNFGDNCLGNWDKVQFFNFVNQALLRWRGARVLKFKVWCPDPGNLWFSDIDLWLRFAIDNGVEDFYLCYLSRICVPQYVYSCSSLKNLCLDWCRLKIDGNVEWNRLLRLSILECFGVTQLVIEQILCGSPLLEVFTLSLETDVSLSFRSTSLKELSISTDKRCCKSKSTELRIWTPNLETLAISGGGFSKYFLENVSSLTHATLGFRGQNGKDSLGFQSCDVLQSVRHVERLTSLVDLFVEMFGNIGTKRMPPLLNVKFLKLSGSFECYKIIVRLLKIFPNIKMLILQEKKKGKSHSTSNLKFKPFVTELKTVEVIWTGHDFSIFPLIEALLKYAGKLEKMVFRVKGSKPPSNALFLTSQKLRRMRKSSPNAELIFCEY